MFNRTYFSFLFCYSLLCLWLRGANQFDVIGPYLNLLEASEKQKISDVFRGCRKRPLAWNRLILYKINCLNEVSLPCFTVIQNSETFSGSILGPTLSQYTLITFLMMLSVILLPMMIMMMQISTFSVIRHLICGSKLELASELEFDLRDSVDWGRNWLVHFNAGKTQLVSFDWSNNFLWCY